jgi:outer membrane protein assembly factor BamB
VTPDRVFVVETADSETVAVRALDRATGAEVWKRVWAGTGSVPFFARSNGDWVRSTPAFDGSTLFVGDMSEVLVALDATNGKERWRVDFPARFGTEIPHFGFASSPLVEGDAVYVQAANSLVKLDKRTGATLWRALDGDGKMKSSGAFSSPVLAEIHGERQLVVLTRLALSGLSTETGKVLWSKEIPSFRGMHILTPVIVGNSIFTSPYKERSYLYTIRRTEQGFEVDESWTNPATGYMSTPVVIDGHAYMHLGNRRVDCIDLATGESRWRSSESFGKYWSMAYQDDKILALDADGSLYLVRADPDAFEVLDTRRISDQETWGHLAIVDDELFVRELEAIAAYRWSRGPAPGDTD